LMDGSFPILKKLFGLSEDFLAPVDPSRHYSFPRSTDPVVRTVILAESFFFTNKKFYLRLDAGSRSSPSSLLIKVGI
jgi:hypothetical protein